MAKVCAYVCNYNKAEDVIKCVASLLAQNIELDVCVVDNASTDYSVQWLREKYGKEIRLIVNEQNLGGSGGFNTGLRDGLNRGYTYIALVDNDVVLAKDAIRKLYEYLETNPTVGIVGPKILQMGKPGLIQDFGGDITTADYQMHGHLNNEDKEQAYGEYECAYLCTCTVLARTSAIRDFGLMPEENYIYWDDVEWSRKCQLAGYRTVAISSAEVWHNLSIVNNISPFTAYYQLRNRLHFFTKYLSDKELPNFMDVILRIIFEQRCGYYMKKQGHVVRALTAAFDDYLHLRRGRAADGLLEPNVHVQTPYEHLQANGNHIFRKCYHVKDVRDSILPAIYVDRYGNCLPDEEAYDFYRGLKPHCDMFKETYLPLMRKAVERIRSGKAE